MQIEQILFIGRLRVETKAFGKPFAANDLTRNCVQQFFRRIFMKKSIQSLWLLSALVAFLSVGISLNAQDSTSQTKTPDPQSQPALTQPSQTQESQSNQDAGPIAASAPKPGPGFRKSSSSRSFAGSVRIRDRHSELYRNDHKVEVTSTCSRMLTPATPTTSIIRIKCYKVRREESESAWHPGHQHEDDPRAVSESGR